MKYPFIFLITLLTFSLKARESQWDYRFEAFSRSYPLGAYARGELGFGIPVWSADSEGPLYGFIRPVLRFQSSGLYNTVYGAMEVYPLSFLGFFVGKSYGKRNLKKLDTYDCNSVICETSNIQRNIWGGKMAMKIGPLFFLTRASWTETEIKDQAGNFYAEELGSLIGSGTKDTIFQSTSVLGLNVTSEDAIGALYKRNFTKNTRQDSAMTVSFYRKTFKQGKGNWGFMIGPGIFHTRQETNHLLGFFLIQYNPEPGLTLF